MRKSFKSIVSITIKKLFKLSLLERLLRLVIRLLGTNNLLIHFIPTNTMYSSNTIRRSKINDLEFELDISSFNNWAIYWMITSEQAPKNMLYDLVSPSFIILDVGAHIGEVSLRMALRANKGHVYSFEGYPPTFDKLKTNIALNKLSNITIINKAIGDQPGFVDFEVNQNNAGSNTIGEVKKEQGNIEMVTLDSYIETLGIDRIDMIKIDIEGFEVNALNGAKNLLTRFHPLLFIEMSDSVLKKQGASALELYQLLLSLGYNEITDIRKNVTIDEKFTFDGIHTDIIAR